MTEQPTPTQDPAAHVVDPTAMTGTVDTTGTGAGVFENYAAVTTVAEVSDERARRALEESQDTANQSPTADEVAAQANAEREASRQRAYQERLNAGLVSPEMEGTLTQSGEGGYDPGVADATGTEPQQPGETTQTPQDDEDADLPEDNGEPLPEQYGTFDPNETGVKQVEEYLNSLPADQRGAQERERVLEAERQGQARVSLVGH